MNRSDICPSCKTRLRYEEPGTYEWECGRWYCPRCKYQRPEGSPRNPFKATKLKPNKRK